MQAVTRNTIRIRVSRTCRAFGRTRSACFFTVINAPYPSHANAGRKAGPRLIRFVSLFYFVPVGGFAHEDGAHLLACKAGHFAFVVYDDRNAVKGDGGGGKSGFKLAVL